MQQETSQYHAPFNHEQRHKPGRRQFCRSLGALLLIGSLPGLVACNNFGPKPFITGRTVTAPQGCTELLQRDPRGDC